MFFSFFHETLLLILLAARNVHFQLGPCVSLRLSQAFTNQASSMDYSYKTERKKRVKLQETFARELLRFRPVCLPLLSLSIAVLLPAYVGLISLPSSSMMASSSAYLFWGTWLPVEPFKGKERDRRCSIHFTLYIPFVITINYSLMFQFCLKQK